MKNSILATALILSSSLLAGSAFAADAPLTREQVRASVLQARADGSLLPINDKGVIQAKAAPSSLTREQVQASVLQARADGTLLPINDKGVIQAKAAPSSVTRVATRAEAVIAARVHTQDFGG